ncbi:TTC27 protein [Operophtera brumata]|uniref:TTC27 protein n=1 Tax=Operophtera brumata TaxID=104452 RepID=A0A0L7L853_OPEBR|nr:TTC27 protein [Operophtera brumata]
MSSRLSYLWASGLQPAWTWRQQLADLYLSLGLVKAALEEYQHLHLWEDVIVCYTLLQLRHKRHWGNFLYDHKKYEECIPHYEKSVEINSIQEGVWLRLGYAALVTEQWETSARAYRRYTYLQPNSFEAWNNLAKVYLNQLDKSRAYRALMEALSMDTGHFEDVLRGIHRLLDILHKYEDVEVLALIVRAVLQDVQDADGNGAAR